MCNEDVPVTDTTAPSTTDNCMATVTVTHQGDSSDGMSPIETITRTYRVTDACSNTVECTQSIVVDDSTAPTITCPTDVTVECSENVPSADTTAPSTSDNCVAALTVTHEGDSSNSSSCPETITRTYRVTDSDSNTSECTQTIVVDDTTNPSITCPSNVTVECSENVPTADTTAPTTSDNCTAAVTVTHQGDSSNSLSCPETITRTYRVTDACSNTAECTQTIVIDDTTNPSITCPADVTVECSENVPSADTTAPTTSDNCTAAVTVTHQGDSSNSLSCPETITRTYRVTDACSNTSECTQTIVVDDTTNPSITCPSDVTVECSENVPSADTTTPTTSDNCTAAVTVTHQGDSSNSLSCPETITRTYRVTDACSNTSECTQTIVVDDTTNPSITCPADVTVECSENVPSADTTTPTTSDNCTAAVTVTHQGDSSNSLSCPETITRTYRVTDACSNTSECTQTIVVDDTTNPSITCPSDVTVECDESTASSDNGLATATDNCDSNPIIIEADVSTQISDGSCSEFSYTITRTFTATDACGNSIACDQIITVEDNTDPSVMCNDISVSLDQGTGMYTFTQSDIQSIGAGSADNCDNDLNYNLDMASVNCLNTPMTTVVLTVSDACGNSNTCSATVTVSGGVPNLETGDYGPICENGSLLDLLGSPIPSGGDTGAWSGPGVVDADNTDGFATFNPSGISGLVTVTYTYVTAAGCIDVVTTDILVNDVPVCSASVNTNFICQEETLALEETGSDAVAWEWEGPDGFSSTDQNPIISNAQPSATGLYTVTVTDINGCTSVCSTEATVYPNPVITVSECICDYDPNINNFGSQVIITVDSGEAPYAIQLISGNGVLENDILLEGQSTTLYLGRNGGAYTIEVMDFNGCMSTISGSCATCSFDDFQIDDPCACNNDQSFNGAGDGTFAEEVTIGGPAGLELVIGSGSTGILGSNVGDLIPEVAPGLYILRFDHIDRIGYTLFVDGRANGNIFPILDSNGNQLTVSNNCQYPIITEPILDIVDFCNNAEPIVFTGNEVSDINGFDGTVQVYVGGVSTGTPINQFDPSLYSNGYYTLIFQFTGDFVNNVGTMNDPAFPGCRTQTSIQVGVGGGDALVCNDNVNMTVNLDCELDFSWSTLLEYDNIPDVFEAQFFGPDGQAIEENELGQFYGSTVTYSIIDNCNGNSCWGTINIEDKNDPVIDCEICPQINGTSADQYDEDCVLNCYDLPVLQLRYDDGLRDDLVQEDYEDFAEDAMSDNCDNWDEEDVSFFDEYTSLGACVGTRLTRTWTVGFTKADGSRGTVSCTREYFFRPFDFFRLTGYDLDPATGMPIFEAKEDSLVVPPQVVELPCAVDISPEGIAAFFDDPTTEDRDTDDNNIDPNELDIDLVVENNEGIRWAYPHYYQEGVGSGGPHAQAINNEACNLIVGYTDSAIDACAPGCEGNSKVLRSWTVLDWCSGTYIPYDQIIKSIDENPPFGVYSNCASATS
jgi:hypothetical protein